jgi:outer membrane protein
LAAKVQEQRQQYEATARPLDEQIRARQNEERNKILAMIKNAIDVVAEREKFDVVLNAGAAVYAKPEYDISDAVAAQVSKAK